MNVRELRDLLNTMPDDAVVVFDTEEYGYWEALSVNAETIFTDGRGFTWHPEGLSVTEVGAVVITSREELA